jgi:hypothetical protein
MHTMLRNKARMPARSDRFDTMHQLQKRRSAAALPCSLLFVCSDDRLRLALPAAAEQT